MNFTIGYLDISAPKEAGKMVKIDHEIENKAREILQAHGLYQVPTDPIKLAQNMNIKVKGAIFNDSSVAGILSFKNGEIAIYVNSTDSYERKRFTVAHELGHYFLGHKEEKVDMYRTINGINNNQEEYDSNKFAAAFLMSRTTLRNTAAPFGLVG